MDLSQFIAPKSDQLDAVDLVGGDRTFTIERVSRNNDEQPINIYLAGFPRPWRPGLSMRRVLVACWGKDASTYVGRRVQLYCDPDVQFGGAAVGGTRIRALSHIDKPKQVPLLIKRGKSAIFVVKPLPDEPQRPVKATAPTTGDGITPEQAKKLWAALNDAQLTDGEAALAFISQEIGRDVASTKELTCTEADAVIDSLGAEPKLPGADN